MNDLDSRLRELSIQPMNSDAYAPAPESELQQLESEVGGRLSEDYRWFLTRYGQSLFENALAFPSSSDLGTLPFAFFYGSNGSGNGVLANYMTYKGQFPRGIIPIGEDGLGNLFVLAATGSNTGKVYYWDHGVGWEGEAEEYRSRGQAVPDSVKYKCLEYLAPTFSDFVSGLQPDED
jgi:hypothetical protein